MNKNSAGRGNKASWRRDALPALAIVGMVVASPAYSQDKPEPGENADDLWTRDTLTGDWSGLRPRLADSGITLGLTEISEFLGNVSGGAKKGFNYDGRTELSVDVDLEKLAGWRGALFHANAYQIHGHGLSGKNLGGNYLPPSNIEADNSTRLFDLYLEQRLFGDQLSIRAGQIAADDEFLTSNYSGAFINGTFGWAGIMAADLPSGGPAYPLATPGVRVKYAPTADFYWQTAVFSGDPAGNLSSDDDPLARNFGGTTFSTDGGTFAISELSYSLPTDNAAGMPASTFKLGGWYHSGAFDDLRYDIDGNPVNETGNPAKKKWNNYGIYGVVDMMLLPKAGTEDQGLAAFLRAGGAPGDRNVISAYVDTGLTYKGPFEGRDDDVAGIAVSFAKISDRAIDADRDYNLANPDATRPIRDHEMVIEATYQFAATPWWTIQPDIQYVIHPAGYAASPYADEALPASAMKDAFIMGARTTIKF